MISAMPALAEARERDERAAVLVFPVRSATVPGGTRDFGDSVPPLSREPVPPPFARRVCREELEEEVLALWEG